MHTESILWTKSSKFLADKQVNFEQAGAIASDCKFICIGIIDSDSSKSVAEHSTLSEN